MFKDEIKNITLILAFLTASLFTYGLTFHQGYLDYWGLEETLFPLSFERTVFQGFVAASHLGAKTLGYLLIASLVFFLAIVIFGWIANQVKDKRWFKKLVVPEQKSKSIPEHLKIGGLLVAISYWLFAGFLILVALLLVATYLGKEAAISLEKKFKDNEIRKVTLLHAKHGELKANSIICSNSHCAYYINDSVTVYPLADIKSINSEIKRITSGSK